MSALHLLHCSPPPRTISPPPHPPLGVEGWRSGDTVGAAGTSPRTARPRALAPTHAQILTAETLAVCAQIDRRLGNQPGTAARGCWFWHWPPEPHQSVELLAALHADAVAFLYGITGEMTA